MQVKEHDIASKRIVGKLKGTPVVELITGGGLNLIAINKNGSAHILSSGPHEAISRHIAETEEPDIEWTEFSKSEGIPKIILDSIAEPWIKLTKEFQGQE